MNPTPEQRAQILIGNDAEEFLPSELGRTVLGMAEQDREAAVIAFAEADPTDAKAMVRIQTDLKVAMRFQQYLGELIVRGRETMHSLKQEE